MLFELNFIAIKKYKYKVICHQNLLVICVRDTEAEKQNCTYEKITNLSPHPVGIRPKRFN